jgi:hypothetical protein
MVELPPGEVAIRASRLKYAGFLLIAIGFVATSILLVRVAHERVVGWAGILVFGAAIPIFARQLLDSRPRLVIGDQGVFDRTLGVGVIPWSEITGVRLATTAGNDFLCLEVRDPAMFTAHFGAVRRALMSGNRALGFAELNLNVSGLSLRSDEILALISARCAATRRS